MAAPGQRLRHQRQQQEHPDQRQGAGAGACDGEGGALHHGTHDERPAGSAGVTDQPPHAQELAASAARREVAAQGHEDAGAEAIAKARQERGGGEGPEARGKRQRGDAGT